MDIQQLIQQVVPIARRAGDAIMDIYQDESRFGVETKSDDSPLTAADRKSNEVIVEGLQSLDTVLPIISEENRAVPYEERKDYEYYWLVDPLDGTKEFIKRNGEFTVNIALIHRDHPVGGVVYAPVMDEMYYASKGHGAHLTKNGSTRQLQAATFSKQDKGLNVVCSRSHLNDETQAYIDGLTEPEKVSKGSSLKFLILAKGEAHLYPRIAPTSEWDTGAAQAVLEEAGGKVLQYGTDEPVRYNKENILNPYFEAMGDLR